MKKSLRPQQTAPVQRQTTAATTASSPGAGGIAPRQLMGWEGIPFAGDDAE